LLSPALLAVLAVALILVWPLPGKPIPQR